LYNFFKKNQDELNEIKTFPLNYPTNFHLKENRNEKNGNKNFKIKKNLKMKISIRLV
jgi:hypothetical protein